MLRSAAHETYHFVENYSAKDAADLRDYVVDALKGKGVDIDEALEKYAKQGYATRDEQISELVADSMFDVFSNEDFIKNLTAKNQTLAKRLANHIGELVNKIRDAVKMLSVRYSNPEINALMNDAEKLDTIRNMLLAGYKNAGENFKAEQAKGQKNYAEGVESKFSYKGKSEDGRSIYQTNYTKGTPKAVKQNDLINLVQNVWSKNPIKMTVMRNGSPKEITAHFNPELSERSDLSKMAFGNRKGRASDQRITLDLASDFYQIAEESKYTKSKDETGKDYNPAHDDVFNWDYFVTNLIYRDEDGIDQECYMNIDVKEKADGHYFYSFAIEKGTAPQTLLAVVTDESATVPTNSIPKTIKSVKQNLSVSDTEYTEQKQS